MLTALPCFLAIPLIASPTFARESLTPSFSIN